MEVLRNGVSIPNVVLSVEGAHSIVRGCVQIPVHNMVGKLVMVIVWKNENVTQNHVRVSYFVKRRNIRFVKFVKRFTFILLVQTWHAGPRALRKGGFQSQPEQTE